MLLSIAGPPSPSPIVTPRPQPTQTAHTEQPSNEPWWQILVYRTFHDPVAFFTLALVGSTILLWTATLKLAREARKSSLEQEKKMERSIDAANRSAVAAAALANTAEDTARKELRSYVGVADLNLLDRWGTDPRFLTLVPNYGKTPASNVTVHATVGIFPQGTAFPGMHQMHHEFGTLEPGRIQSVVNGFDPNYLIANAAALTSGALVLTMWGTVTYSDIYGRSYSKDFTAYISHRRINNHEAMIGAAVHVADEIETQPVDEEGGEAA